MESDVPVVELLSDGFLLWPAVQRIRANLLCWGLLGNTEALTVTGCHTVSSDLFCNVPLASKDVL